MNNFKKSAIIWFIVSLQLFIASQLSARVNTPDRQQVQYTEAELAQILAPIALYPDSLLTHIVIASTYPLEIVQAQRWREDNSYLDAAQAVEEAEQQGWDPSVAALVAFPNVLERLSDDLDWTQSLGEAFLLDEEAVLDSIQDLRQQAERANTLEEMQNVRVIKVERQIIIEPVRKEIVYVPYYDTRVVYGNWRWHRYPPIYWDFRPHVSVSFSNRFSNRFQWSPGIHVNFNYFFGAFQWHSRQLVVTHHHHTRHYRSHKRIAFSHGAKRWQHNSIHRRGVVYKAHHLNTRFKHHSIAGRDNNTHRHHTVKKHLKQNRQDYNYRNEPRDDRYSRSYQSTDRHSVTPNLARENKGNDKFAKRDGTLKASNRFKKDLKDRSQGYDKFAEQSDRTKFRTKHEDSKKFGSRELKGLSIDGKGEFGRSEEVRRHEKNQYNRATANAREHQELTPNKHHQVKQKSTPRVKEKRQ